MNKAIDIATGMWIIFMNAGDTFFNETVIERAFYNKEYKLNTGVIFGDAYSIKKDKKNCIFLNHFILKKQNIVVWAFAISQYFVGQI